TLSPRLAQGPDGEGGVVALGTLLCFLPAEAVRDQEGEAAVNCFLDGRGGVGGGRAYWQDHQGNDGREATHGEPPGWVVRIEKERGGGRGSQQVDSTRPASRLPENRPVYRGCGGAALATTQRGSAVRGSISR